MRRRSLSAQRWALERDFVRLVLENLEGTHTLIGIICIASIASYTNLTLTT